MNPNIRWRIGGSVFLLVALLHAGLSWYWLNELHKAQREQIDDDLFEELVEAEELLESSDWDRRRFVQAETSANTKWDEDFFAFYGPSGEVLAQSSNVPEPDGLGTAPNDAEVLQAQLRDDPMEGTALVWERVHPRSRKGHIRIRIAELKVNGYRVVAAESLKATQKSYWALREKLAGGLVIIAALGAAGAWLVTRRSLAPIQAIAERASQLGGEETGLLPRTGSGDELDRLAEVLNVMVERIRGEVARVRRVSADVAHTLRTPLTVLRGTIELNLRTGTSAQRTGSLESALEIVDDLSNRISQLLLLQNLESAGLHESRITHLDLGALAKDLVETLQVVADERQIKLLCRARSAPVRGDEAQLRQAITNLIDNALRHTPRHGWIDVSIGIERSDVRLVVLDSGPGLRTDQLERVFERFYTERIEASGGLGLAIARAIAVAHGGSLDASSPDGARFELRLPRAS